MHIKDASDETVRWLYENCEFTLFPSLYEGWGLPVSESLLHGKVCLASDRSSIREVEPDLTELLDPFDVSLWAKRVQYWHGNPAARAAKEKLILDCYVRPKWSDAVDTIVAALDASGPRQVLWQSELNKLTLVGEDAPHFKTMGPPTGFHAIESTGVWTSAQTAYFQLGIPATTVSDLWLTLKVNTLVENDVEISINGNTPHRFRVSPVGKIITIPISQRDVLSTDALSVALSADTLHAPKDIQPLRSEDERRLGVFLSGFGVFTNPEKASEAWHEHSGVSERHDKISLRPPSWPTSIKTLLRKSRRIK